MTSGIKQFLTLLILVSILVLVAKIYLQV